MDSKIRELDHIGAAVCLCDASDRIHYANALYRAAFLGADDERPKDFTAAIMTGMRARRGIRLVSEQPDSFEARVRRRRRDQIGCVSFTADTWDGRWWSVTDSKLPSGWILAIAQDITSLKHKEFQLRDAHASALEEASTDFLTGISNRRQGFRSAEAAFNACLSDERPLTIAILDLDHFKRINDTYGHDVGDKALVHFSTLVSRHMRVKDGFSRIGGEEFLLVAPDHDPDELDRRLTLFLRPIPPLCLGIGERALRLTVSVGLARAVRDETFDGLLRRADQAVYNAKLKGRDRTEHAPPPEDECA